MTETMGAGETTPGSIAIGSPTIAAPTINVVV